MRFSSHTGQPDDSPAVRPWWRRWLGEPTLHFLVLGGALLVVYPLLEPPATTADAPEIVIPAATVQSLVDGWTQSWQRPPSPSERTALIEDEVRSEVLAREAMARGLDRGDPAIRTLLREKMELLAEHGEAIGEPSEAELLAFYHERKQAFGGGRTVSFSQVVLDPAQHGAAFEHDAAELLARLQNGVDEDDPAARGDPSELPPDYVDLPEEQLQAMFGAEFAAKLAELAPGRWAGPFSSPFGMHLVRLAGWGEAPMQPFDEVRDAVREEWQAEQLQAVRDRAYAALRQHYRVVIEAVAPLTAAATADSTGVTR